LGEHEAQAYKDPGTPEEQSRRTFLANATLGIGGIIGLTIAIPVVSSLIPESLLSKETGKGTWSPLTADEFKSLDASTNNPVKLAFSFEYTDGYLTSTENQFVWGVKLTPDQVSTFKAKRPDIYDRPGGNVPYDALYMSFVIFSSICPHLGCTYNWQAETKRFFCPCHGSQYGIQGEYLAGPAPRGLDPLPLRQADGKAEVTWVVYKTGQPTRLIVAYH
jgi:Rieske Fe-S protein